MSIDSRTPPARFDQLQSGANPPANRVLAAQLMEIRRSLRGEIQGLVDAGTMGKEVLVALHGGSRYLHIAYDVRILVAVTRLVWPFFDDPADDLPEGLTRAEDLASALLAGIGRTVTPAGKMPPAQTKIAA